MVDGTMLNFIEDLPRDDILHRHIFCYLTIPDLFRLRMVSQSVLEVVDDYFSRLHHINISVKDGTIDEAAFQIMTKNNSSLRTLIAPNMGEWIEDDILVPVIKNCPNLSTIDLSQCLHISNGSLSTLRKHCNALVHVSLGGCSWVNKDNFMGLVACNSNLKSLNIQNCVKLDDDSVEFMAKHCKNLEHLTLSEISRLTDRSLEAVAKNCKKLEHLSVVACWRMTDSGIRVILEYSKGLKTLNCEHCRNVSEEVLGALRFRGVVVDIQQRLEASFRRLDFIIDYARPMVKRIHYNI